MIHGIYNAKLENIYGFEIEKRHKNTHFNECSIRKRINAKITNLWYCYKLLDKIN